jgi:predicted DNA-binding transcriptional regulator YafY
VPFLATIRSRVGGAAAGSRVRRGERIVTRVVDPLRLVLKDGIWYLVAAHEGQLRTYRVSRVVGARPLDAPARRPQGFDLAAYWAESIAAYEREAPRIEVTLRVRRDATRWLEDVLDASLLAAAVDLPDPEPADWRRLRLRMDWPREIAGRLLALGGAIEVLEPPELRRDIATLATAAAERYRVPVSG